MFNCCHYNPVSLVLNFMVNHFVLWCCDLHTMLTCHSVAVSFYLKAAVCSLKASPAVYYLSLPQWTRPLHVRNQDHQMFVFFLLNCCNRLLQLRFRSSHRNTPPLNAWLIFCLIEASLFHPCQSWALSWRLAASSRASDCQEEGHCVGLCVTGESSQGYHRPVTTIPHKPTL